MLTTVFCTVPTETESAAINILGPVTKQSITSVEYVHLIRVTVPIVWHYFHSPTPAAQ